MRKTITGIAAVLMASLSVWLVAGKREVKDDPPYRVLILVEGAHDREGIGKFPAISVADREKIAKLEDFFPDYRQLPSSDIAGGWKAGSSVYFDFGQGRTVRVTVSKNDDGKTWSVGRGDFRTHGDFGAFLAKLQEPPKSDQKP
jgi:hypothetical protein